MLQPNKTDAKLGKEIHELLLNMGLETPMQVLAFGLNDKSKIERVRISMHAALAEIGLDLSDDSLQDTPLRVAKMLVEEQFWGLNPNNFPKITTVENKMGYNMMLVERNVASMSVCEHHLVTIDGKAHVAYIPKNKVLGLSKINRIVEYFSRRPQIQERLTMQIGTTLKYILGTDDVAVVIDAVHYCVKSRGVEDGCSDTGTQFLSGAFLNEPSCRAEFFQSIRK